MNRAGFVRTTFFRLMSAVAVMMIAVLVAFSGQNTIKAASDGMALDDGTVSDPDVDDMNSAQIIALINEYRAENGLSALTENAKLTEIAQIRADEMAEAEYFSHTRPNGLPWKSLYTDANGNQFSNWGAENLSRSKPGATAKASKVVEGWKASPGHDATLKEIRATLVGIGIAKSASGRYYVAAEFANEIDNSRGMYFVFELLIIVVLCYLIKDFFMDIRLSHKSPFFQLRVK